MKKIIQNFAFNSLVAVLLVTMIAFSANKPDSDLEKRVSELEERVALIEENISENDAVDTSENGSQNRQNWRELREGMSQEKVEELLGRPYRIDGGSSAIWHYQLGGRVHFSNGKVNRWSEPY